MATTKYIVDNKSEQEIDGDLAISGDLAIDGDVNITGNTNIRPYKVYTALLTQSGVDVVQEFTGGNLTIGVTYEIYEAAGGAEGFDFTNVGAPNNNFGTYFVATGTTPDSWGNNNVGLRYNEGAPVVTVLENTIGNIWFAYNNIGSYYLYSDNLFTLNKTWNTRCIDIGTHGPSSRATLFDSEDLNSMQIQSESDVDTPSNDILYRVPIEIRVYN